MPHRLIDNVLLASHLHDDPGRDRVQLNDRVGEDQERGGPREIILCRSTTTSILSACAFVEKN